MKSRTCGDCVACCVYLRIDDPELKKAPMHHCKHLNLGFEVDDTPKKNNVAYYTGSSCKGNCKVHLSKPETCKGYSCAWLHGFGLESDRPDKSLILFDVAHQIENSIEAKPLMDGQENTPKGKETIERFSRDSGRPVIVTNFYERKIQRIVGRAVE
jgi:hypothetical protein